MNKETEQNKIKVLFLQRDPQGKRFGSGEWIDGVTIYINNFRTKENRMVADVDIKTDETYVNKQGKVCNRHKVCGILSLTQDEATIIVELDGKKEKLTCEPRKVTGRANGKEYLLLDFANERTNPYEADLGLGTETKEIDVDDLDSVAEEMGL